MNYLGISDNELKKRYGDAGFPIPIIIAVMMLFVEGFSLLVNWKWWVFVILGMFIFAVLMTIPYLLVEKTGEKFKAAGIIFSVIIYLFYLYLAYILFNWLIK